MNQLETKDDELELSSSSSLEEIIAKKQLIQKAKLKPKNSNSVYKFYLSFKNNKYKLTNAKQKIVKEFDTFFEAISDYIDKGETLLEDNIPSRIWLYDKGSFRATLTLSALKDLVANNTINTNSNNLEITEERLNELLLKEEKLETLEKKQSATTINTQKVQPKEKEIVVVSELDDFNIEMQNAIKQYHILKSYKTKYLTSAYFTWISLLSLIFLIIITLIKGV